MGDDPEKVPCPRCGKVDCEVMPPGHLENLIEFLKNAPRIEREYDEPPEAF